MKGAKEIKEKNHPFQDLYSSGELSRAVTYFCSQLYAVVKLDQKKWNISYTITFFNMTWNMDWKQRQRLQEVMS